MKDNFNSNFYITAATVIPLFYITLFLQSSVVQGLAKKVGDKWYTLSGSMNEALERLLKRDFRLNVINVARIFLFSSYVLLPVATLILASAIAGIAAEAISLWALYYQSDNTVMRAIVLWSMLGLLALVCANPTMTIVRNILSLSPPDESGEEQPSSEEEQRKRASLGCLLRLIVGSEGAPAGHGLGLVPDMCLEARADVRPLRLDRLQNERVLSVPIPAVRHRNLYFAFAAYY
jgi:hypothetical protein